MLSTNNLTESTQSLPNQQLPDASLSSKVTGKHYSLNPTHSAQLRHNYKDCAWVRKNFDCLVDTLPASELKEQLKSVYAEIQSQKQPSCIVGYSREKGLHVVAATHGLSTFGELFNLSDKSARQKAGQSEHHKFDTGISVHGPRDSSVPEFLIASAKPIFESNANFVEIMSSIEKRLKNSDREFVSTRPYGQFDSNSCVSDKYLSVFLSEILQNLPLLDENDEFTIGDTTSLIESCTISTDFERALNQLRQDRVDNEFSDTGIGEESRFWQLSKQAAETRQRMNGAAYTLRDGLQSISPNNNPEFWNALMTIRGSHGVDSKRAKEIDALIVDIRSSLKKNEDQFEDMLDLRVAQAGSCWPGAKSLCCSSTNVSALLRGIISNIGIVAGSAAVQYGLLAYNAYQATSESVSSESLLSIKNKLTPDQLDSIKREIAQNSTAIGMTSNSPFSEASEALTGKFPAPQATSPGPGFTTGLPDASSAFTDKRPTTDLISHTTREIASEFSALTPVPWDDKTSIAVSQATKSIAYSVYSQDPLKTTNFVTAMLSGTPSTLSPDDMATAISDATKHILENPKVVLDNLTFDQKIELFKELEITPSALGAKKFSDAVAIDASWNAAAGSVDNSLFARWSGNMRTERSARNIDDFVCATSVTESSTEHDYITGAERAARAFQTVRKDVFTLAVIGTITNMVVSGALSGQDLKNGKIDSGQFAATLIATPLMATAGFALADIGTESGMAAFFPNVSPVPDQVLRFLSRVTIRTVTQMGVTAFQSFVDSGFKSSRFDIPSTALYAVSRAGVGEIAASLQEGLPNPLLPADEKYVRRASETLSKFSKLQRIFQNSHDLDPQARRDIQENLERLSEACKQSASCLKDWKYAMSCSGAFNDLIKAHNAGQNYDLEKNERFVVKGDGTLEPAPFDIASSKLLKSNSQNTPNDVMVETGV